MKRVCEGTSHLTDNMKAEIRQVNILVMQLDTCDIFDFDKPAASGINKIILKFKVIKSDHVSFFTGM